jgi:hypothetical protein
MYLNCIHLFPFEGFVYLEEFGSRDIYPDLAVAACKHLYQLFKNQPIAFNDKYFCSLLVRR